MIKLINLLKEINNNNSSEIYHFTSYSSCQKIINSNKLLSNKADVFFSYDKSRILPEYKKVIFFTEGGDRFGGDDPSDECILVIDKQKILKDYKVISYGDPYEETVLYTNGSYIPILTYLKEVTLLNTLQKSKLKKLIPFLEENNIRYQIDYNLEKRTKEKQSALPTLKKELIGKLTKSFPNGFIGYLNQRLLPFQTKSYFESNPIFSYPNISINKPGEISNKNKFQVLFKINPQDLEKTINWYTLSVEDIKNLIDLEKYDGVNLDLKGDIEINKII
jgi:hypothetical protein